LRDARFGRGRLRNPGYRHPLTRTTSIVIVGARGRDNRRRRSPRHFLLRRILLRRLALARRARVTHVELGGGGGASETAASFIAGLAGST